MNGEFIKLKLREVVYLLLPLFLAPALWLLQPRFVGASYGQASMPFEIFGFLCSLAVILIGYLKYRQGYSPVRLVVWFGFASVVLVMIVEFYAKSWDYNCYESAAKAILEGASPYGSPDVPCYFYPPLYAQLLLGLSNLFLKLGVAAEKAWGLVFFVHHASHFYFALVFWLILSRVAGVCGVNPPRSEIFAAAFLIFNTAFVRNMVHHQLNFATLAATLGALWLAGSVPWLSGLLLSFGIGLKLFPLFLFIPLFYARRYKAIAWSLVWGTVMLAAAVIVNPKLWLDYASHSLPPTSPFYRNASFVALLGSISYFVYPALLAKLNVVARVISVGWFFAAIAILVSLRPKRSRVISDSVAWAFYGLTLALGLLGSPLLWPHQMIMALPLAVWLFSSSEKPWGTLVPIILTFGFPVFDVFPFSYHRLVGLIWLLVIGYRRIRAAGVAGSERRSR